MTEEDINTIPEAPVEAPKKKRTYRKKKTEAPAEPRWMSMISNTLLAEEMSLYFEEMTSKYTIENLEDRLKYLIIQEAMQMN